MIACIWAGFGIAAWVMLGRSLKAHARKRAVSWLAAALIVGAGMFQLDSVRRYGNLAGDTLHFAAMYPSYLERIRKLPDDGQPKLIVFNFGGMIWASGGVVYDESDEIAKPFVDQSAAWKLRADRTELGCGHYAYTRLFQHFYLADFPC